MAARGDAAGYKVAYDAGLQAVAEQASTLRETGIAAGSLMSAAAVAGGLAAGLAFSADPVGGIDQLGVVGAVLAVAGFVGVVVTTVMTWRPPEGRFVHDAGVIVGSYLEGEPPLDLAEVHRELALWLGRQTESNRRMLERSSRRSAGASSCCWLRSSELSSRWEMSQVEDERKTQAQQAPPPPEPSRPDPSVSEKRGATEPPVRR